MTDMLLHDSQDLFYRSPGGALTAGSHVMLRLRCDEATSVILRTWMDEELCYAMMPSADHVWELALDLPDHPGLFWYYFIIYRLICLCKGGVLPNPTFDLPNTPWGFGGIKELLSGNAFPGKGT